MLLVYATGVLAAAALGKVAPAIPLLRADLGLSLGRAGWLVSAITAVAALLGTPLFAWAAGVAGWGVLPPFVVVFTVLGLVLLLLAEARAAAG